MPFCRLCILPLIFPIIAICTFIVSYCMAVTSDHIVAALPFISDMGSTPPESCLFSLGVNIAIIFLVWALYVRYLQTSAALLEARAREEKRLRLATTCSYLAVVFAIIFPFGILLLANFQKTFCYATHLAGATLYMVGADIYVCCQVELDIPHYANETQTTQHVAHSNNAIRVGRAAEHSSLCVWRNRPGVVRRGRQLDVDARRRRVGVPRGVCAVPVVHRFVPLRLLGHLLLPPTRALPDATHREKPGVTATDGVVVRAAPTASFTGDVVATATTVVATKTISVTKAATSSGVVATKATSVTKAATSSGVVATKTTSVIKPTTSSEVVVTTATCVTKAATSSRVVVTKATSVTKPTTTSGGVVTKAATSSGVVATKASSVIKPTTSSEVVVTKATCVTKAATSSGVVVTKATSVTKPTTTSGGVVTKATSVTKAATSSGVVATEATSVTKPTTSSGVFVTKAATSSGVVATKATSVTKSTTTSGGVVTKATFVTKAATSSGVVATKATSVTHPSKTMNALRFLLSMWPGFFLQADPDSTRPNEKLEQK